MEDFSSTGQLVTIGLVDSPIGAMAKGLALADVEVSITKAMLLSLEHHGMPIVSNLLHPQLPLSYTAM